MSKFKKGSIKSRIITAAWIVACCAVLLAVFAMYTGSDFLVLLSNQLWTCS